MDLAILGPNIVGAIATTWKEHPGDIYISKGAKEGVGYGVGQGGGPHLLETSAKKCKNVGCSS